VGYLFAVFFRGDTIEFAVDGLSLGYNTSNKR
jgi:hypothetical protein